MNLPADVERYVARSYPERERRLVLELFRKAVLHDGKPASPRLLRCALLTSGGSLDSLRAQVEHMAIDYRDLILQAEYERRHGEFVQVRDLNEPLAEGA